MIGDTQQPIPVPVPLGFEPAYQMGFIVSRSRGWVIWRDVPRRRFLRSLMDSGMLKENTNPSDADVIFAAGLTMVCGRTAYRARSI